MAHFLRQIAVFALFTCWAGVWAQQATAPKWGKIEPAQFGPDLAGRFPDAAAVVLHDYGELSFGMGTEGYLVILDRHVRIRILTEAGGSLAVQSIPYISGLPGENEVVRRVRAQTLYEQGGKVIAVPVPGSDIRTEQAEPGWMEIRISFPEIKPGAILEYTYRMVSPNYYRPPEWPFQREIPTLISEVKMRPNKLLDYAILLRGGRGELSTTGAWKIRPRSGRNRSPRPSTTTGAGCIFGSEASAA